MDNKGKKGPVNTKVYAPTHKNINTGDERLASGKSINKREGVSFKSKKKTIKPKPETAGLYVQKNNITYGPDGYVIEPLGKNAARQKIKKDKPAKNKGKKVKSLYKEKPISRKGKVAPKKNNPNGIKKGYLEEITIDKGSMRSTRIVRPIEDERTIAKEKYKKTESAKKIKRDGSKKKGIHRIQGQEKRKKKERKPVNAKKILGVLIFFVGFAIVLTALYYAFLTDNAEIEGNEKYTDDNIIALAELNLPKHILLINLESVKNNIQQNPYIKVLNVEWVPPRTIKITVREREEAAAIRVQDYDVLIDNEGYVLSIGGGESNSNILRVYGISQLGFQINENINKRGDIQAVSLLLIMESLIGSGQWDDIVSLDITNPLRITLLTKENICVVLGQSDNLGEKLRWMKETLPSLRAGGITSGELNVSAKGGAVYSPAQTDNANNNIGLNSDVENMEDELPISREEDGGDKEEEEEEDDLNTQNSG